MQMSHFDHVNDSIQLLLNALNHGLPQNHNPGEQCYKCNKTAKMDQVPGIIDSF